MINIGEREHQNNPHVRTSAFLEDFCYDFECTLDRFSSTLNIDDVGAELSNSLTGTFLNLA